VPRCARSLSKLSSAIRKLDNPASPSAEPDESSDPSTELALFASTPIGEGERPREPKHLHPAAQYKAREAAPPPGQAVLPPPNTSREFPDSLTQPLENALNQTEAWLARNEPAAFRESLLELFFRLYSFQRTAELYDERYVTIIEPGRSVHVRLFCLDPSFLLRQALGRGKAAVFFSATLTPIDYYRALLGGDEEDRLLQLPSPFPPQHLAVLVQDRIRTHFKARAESLADVVQAIAALVEGRRGNYLAYFPSYQYLTAVQKQFHALHPEVPILVQRPGMSEPERDAFLAAFAAEHGETLVGFAVMGGVFGEGIDLVGDRLIGAIIVGVGLPQLCVERDLIRDYFQERTGAGFDYAYTFPGMNRVLQAIGRVIRSETDHGVVLLIDARFNETRYRRLFPAWWKYLRVRNTDGLRGAIGSFWERLSD
jgi:DNA excision repair protein ERCC-2